MSMCQVGKFSSHFTIEWTIPSIQEFLLQGHNYVRSPNFHVSFTCWYLSLSLESEEWIGIFLHRTDTGEARTISYSIRLQDRFGVVEITQADRFSEKHASLGEPKFVKRESALNRIVQHPSTITFHINNDTSYPMQSRLEFVPYAVPDSVSCAIQTEFPNCVNDKEDPKDLDWSALDSKDSELLSERMKKLLIKYGDHDVRIYVQGKEFRAHRNILSARSPVLAMMLAPDTKKNITGPISIEDCDPESFNEFLLYVYSGRTENLTPSNALQLYYTADKYDFPVLKERCVSILKTSLSVASICDAVLLAAKHQEKQLLQMATEFFAQNVKEILATVGWMNFMSQNPVEANELYIKSIEILLPNK